MGAFILFSFITSRQTKSFWQFFKRRETGDMTLPINHKICINELGCFIRQFVFVIQILSCEQSFYRLLKAKNVLKCVKMCQTLSFINDDFFLWLETVFMSDRIDWEWTEINNIKNFTWRMHSQNFFKDINFKFSFYFQVIFIMWLRFHLLSVSTSKINFK